jgi:hypothetical protein
LKSGKSERDSERDREIDRERERDRGERDNYTERDIVVHV